MATHGTGIIYLHKEGFQLYSPLYKTIFEFHFVPEIVHDLDVINEDLLKELIHLFIDNNKIPPLNLACIIADNAAFLQDFQHAPGQTTPDTKKIEDFLDHVPFDNVASKNFPIPNGVRVLATNQALYDAIKAAFLEKDFVIDTILPALPFGGDISAKPIIDNAVAATILQKYPSLREYALTSHTPVHTTKEKPEAKEYKTEELVETTSAASDPTTDKAKERKRLIVLVSVFIVLVILLVIVYLNTPQV